VAAVAVVPRLAGYNPSSLWLDDAWMALVHKAPSVTDSVGLGPSAPGFAVLLYGWLKAAGFTNAHAQLPALLLGVAACAAVYLVGVRIGLGRLPALAAALVLAWSPAHARYSVAVKQYSLDSLLAVGLLLLGVGAAQSPLDRRRWAGLVGASGLAMVMSGSTAPVAVAAVAVAAGSALWQARGRMAAAVEPLLWAGGFAVVLALWAVLVVRPRVPAVIRDFWLGYYVNGPRSLATAASRVAHAFSGLPAAATVVLVAAAMALAVRRHPALVAVVALSLLGAVAAAVVEAAPLGSGRADISLFPGLALVLGAGIDALPSARIRPPAAAAAVASVALAAATGLLYPSHALAYPREDTRPLVRLLDARSVPSDDVVVYPLATFSFALYTHLPVTLRRDDHDPQATGFSRSVRRAGTVLLRTGTPYAEQLQGRLEGRRVWVLTVLDHSDFADIGPALRAQGYRLAEVHRKPGAALVLWER
jgi:hypothetical protein